MAGFVMGTGARRKLTAVLCRGCLTTGEWHWLGSWGSGPTEHVATTELKSPVLALLVPINHPHPGPGEILLMILVSGR